MPGEPRNITALATGPTSITVTWQTPAITNGVIVRYELSVSSDPLSGSGQGEFNITDSKLEFTATMLSPFTNYTFEVAAVTGAGHGMSVTLTETTEEDGKSSYFNTSIAAILYYLLQPLQLLTT